VLTPEFIIGFARQSIELAILVSAPVLLVSLVVGTVLSIIQTATQIQEMTLTFVPKIISIFITLLLFFPWIMDKMLTFTRDLIINIPNFIR
jgi:flagellar biosynthetic protein FliQ